MNTEAERLCLHETTSKSTKSREKKTRSEYNAIIIFKEWLPLNSKYEIADGYNIEWYDTQNDTKSAIWIPVRAK